jgi:vacuole morphology and inheritance protein 14
VEAFIPLLRERLTVLNPYVRQFLVGWITVLDSVPDIDMLEFLPDFLDGVLNMLSDPNREIRQQADTALAEFLHEVKSASFIDYKRLTEILVVRAASPDEFTRCGCGLALSAPLLLDPANARLTSITWLHEFVVLGKSRMVPYAADILGAVLPCLAHAEERVAAVAARLSARVPPACSSHGLWAGRMTRCWPSTRRGLASTCAPSWRCSSGRCLRERSPLGWLP